MRFRTMGSDYTERAVTSDEVLTIKEVAVLLKLAEKTVYSMAQQGELPAFKVRGQWRVRRCDFDSWLEQQASSDASLPSSTGGSHE
jgi:excisionase family DNA binding protein